MQDRYKTKLVREVSNVLTASTIDRIGALISYVPVALFLYLSLLIPFEIINLIFIASSEDITSHIIIYIIQTRILINSFLLIFCIWISIEIIKISGTGHLSYEKSSICLSICILFIFLLENMVFSFFYNHLSFISNIVIEDNEHLLSNINREKDILNETINISYINIFCISILVIFYIIAILVKIDKKSGNILKYHTKIIDDIVDGLESGKNNSKNSLIKLSIVLWIFFYFIFFNIPNIIELAGIDAGEIRDHFSNSNMVIFLAVLSIRHAAYMPPKTVFTLNEERKFLYLRSFQEDEGFSIFRVLKSVFPSLETSLSMSLVRAAPLISIQNPSIWHREGKAYRTGFIDGDWQENVITWMKQSELIFIQIGESEGIKWEMRQCVTNEFYKKTIFISPEGRDCIFWQNIMKNVFADTPWFTAISVVEDAESVQAVVFYEDHTIGVVRARSNRIRPKVLAALTLAGDLLNHKAKLHSE